MIAKITHADIRCICGNSVEVEIGGGRIPCHCGAELYAVTQPDGYVQPFAHVPDGVLQADQFPEPAIIGWRWSTGEYDDRTN